MTLQSLAAPLVFAEKSEIMRFGAKSFLKMLQSSEEAATWLQNAFLVAEHFPKIFGEKSFFSHLAGLTKFEKVEKYHAKALVFDI